MPATPTLTVTNNSDGTATFEIADSSGGSSNAIYWSRIELPEAGWTLVTTITGDGLATVAVQAGLKWFYCASTLTGSVAACPPVPAVITTNVLAVYERLLQAVGTTIQGAVVAGSIDLIDSADRVQRMDYIADPTRFDTADLKCDLPCIIYGPGLMENFVVGTSLSASDDFDYPILVSIIDRKEARYMANNPVYLQGREVVRQLFNQRRVSGVFESKTSQVQFEIALDHSKEEENWHQFASALRLICSTRELRWS